MLEQLWRPALSLGLGEGELSLLQATGGWRARADGRPAPRHAEAAVPPDAAAGSRFAALLDALGGLLAEQAPRPGSAVDVVLADRWLRLWLVTPPRNALRRRDCEVAAAARFEALYGEPLGEGYRLAADWQARRAFLAAAMPTETLLALQALLQQHGLRLGAVQAHFVAAWNRLRRGVPEQAWFGKLDAGRLTLAARGTAGWLALRELVVSPPALGDTGWLRATAQREAARLGLAAPRCVALAGPVPPAWLAAPGEDWQCLALQPDAAAGSAAADMAMLGLA